MKRYSAFALFISVFLLTGVLQAQSVTELKARFKRSNSKTERMNLSYQIAEKQLNSSPTETTEYASIASELANEVGDKRREAEALYLSAEGLYRRRSYKEAAARYNNSWQAARNYGLYDLALSSMDRLQDIGLKQNDLREALKWSQETNNYLKGNTGRSSSSGDALRRLETKLTALETENRLLKEQLANASGQSQNLASTYEQQLQEVQSKTQQELSKREETITQISQEKSKSDSLVKTKARLLETLTAAQMVDSIVRSEQKLQIETQKTALAEAKLAQQQSEAARNVLLLLVGFVLIIAVLFFLRYRAKRRTANDLSIKNKIIEEEQKKSDTLLLNILPPAIAQELKTKNKVAAQQYDQATVMFVDFTGFTKIAELLTPESLVAELDYCFTNFDHIITKYKLEKIKTVGDAYICACGLSDKRAQVPDMIKAALEIQDFLQFLKAQHLSQNMPYFEARVGIHTGPVVAGVVGEKKFAYDIWGDTVNTAARMEETCEPGRVNVSEDTYWLAKYDFEWHSRGKIAAKNKGSMDMYYVTGLKNY
ncbi:MAG: adenylate/guanylate cyclase [Saprospiraceae bacterium]|nr:adenylate/guanylate cyclase [Saprospiraceae bacterium]